MCAWIACVACAMTAPIERADGFIQSSLSAILSSYSAQLRLPFPFSLCFSSFLFFLCSIENVLLLYCLISSRSKSCQLISHHLLRVSSSLYCNNGKIKKRYEA
ncbi:hypothetical protein V8E52_001885 [Russula decolorans]|jgi:hypothetical protein